MTSPAIVAGLADSEGSAEDSHAGALQAADAQRRVLNRLRRAQGQLAAVIRGVEEGKHCRDVVTQLAATSKALDRAGVILISNAMHDCITGPVDGSDAEGLSPAELEKLFMMFA